MQEVVADLHVFFVEEPVQRLELLVVAIQGSGEAF
jgi:hypothetical protein